MLATSTAKVGEVEPHRPIASLTQVDAAGIATPTSAFLATMSPSSRAILGGNAAATEAARVSRWALGAGQSN
jgi:hypothetical protein